VRFVMAYEGILNISSLNLERATELRKMPMIYLTKDGKPRFVSEVPAISGLMLKHWHFRNLINLSREAGDKICFFCNRLEAIRLPPEQVQRYYEELYKVKYGDKEIELIENCVGEDVHGFLAVVKGKSLRREGNVKFSWAIALGGRENEEYQEEAYRRIVIVQHSRHVREIPPEEEVKRQLEALKSGRNGGSGKNEKKDEFNDLMKQLKQLQMPYPKPYTSEVFGFTTIADLSAIGVSLTDNGKTIDPEVRKIRQRNTILAYAKMLFGEIGANLSRSLPIAGKFRLLIAASKKGHIPPPVHPVYPNYLVESVKLIKDAAELFQDPAIIRIYAYDMNRETKNALESGDSDLVDVKVVETPFTEGFGKVLEFLGL